MIKITKHINSLPLDERADFVKDYNELKTELKQLNMNREIKFRVWDKEKKVFIPTDVWAIVHTDFRAFGVMLKDWENYKEGEYFYENSQELSQYTGLKDKNGKEIYEGDWCMAQFRTKDGIQAIQGKIIMDEYMWCIDCTESIGDDIFSINRPHNFEIIGNIYENPELL